MTLRSIIYTCDHTTVRFAARQLAAYHLKMIGRSLPIRRVRPSKEVDHCWLINCDDPSGAAGGSDRFEVRGNKSRVVLRGNRPRSCLYAVYRYLEVNGVRFLRPGPDGEVVPARSMFKVNVVIREQAAHDHRCICHEGATSIKHALAMVDWMAKHRMNEFQLQFETSLPFWNRWYNHELNPSYPAHRGNMRHKKLSIAQSRRLDATLIRALKLRDIDVHRMGHGWTSASLGVTAKGWSKSRKPPPRHLRSRIAKVNGRRDWFESTPGNTQLCLSNRRAFEGLVDTVVRYAATHDEADVVLFCLADGMNQHCECTGCRRLTVTDWYARVVNTISRSLLERGLKTRVSFDAYVDLLWPPQKYFIDDRGGNLIFMLAPFFRCYEHALYDPACADDYPVVAWPRNQTPTINSNRAYVQLLRQWQAHCTVDSFLCDYHFIRMHYYVLDEWMVAQCVHRDVSDLIRMGFNGLFSCQVLRAFYPTGVAMTVMAATLWDRSVSLDQVVNDTLRSAFGRHAREVERYLKEVHRALRTVDIGHGHLMYGCSDPRAAADAVALCERWSPRIKRMNQSAVDRVVKRSFGYLIHYNSLMKYVCRAAGHMAEGDEAAARGEIGRATDFMCRSENRTHWAVDTWNVNLWAEERILRWRDGPRWFEKQQR